MKKAGATNTKILHKSESEVSSKPPIPQFSQRARQIPQSAKTLSVKSLYSARSIQQGMPLSKESRFTKSSTNLDRQYSTISRKSQLTSANSKPPLPGTAKSRPTTSKSGHSGYSVTIMDEAYEQEIEEEYPIREPIQIKRRVSWAFETPIIPMSHKEMSLSETQALLRSQIRMKNETVVPPDFIYLTVNAIQNSMKQTETNANTEINTLDNKKIQINTRLRENRPSSSPSKIDPRARIPTQEIDISQFEREVKETDTLSEVSFKSAKSTKSKDSHQLVSKTVDKEVYSTKCHVKPLRTAPKLSIHPKHIHTTLPKARIIRPISASVTRKEPAEYEQDSRPSRPITAPMARIRPETASTIPSQIAASLPGQPQKRTKATGISTLGSEANVVPMLMYPPDMKEKLAAKLKEKRQQRTDDLLESASEVGTGKVSQYNDPMRSHVKFELRTNNQERNYIIDTEKLHKERFEKEEAMMERKKRLLWTAKARGQGIERIQSAPQ